eukprot:6197615-Pyramimonas_sp.AAC.1
MGPMPTGGGTKPAWAGMPGGYTAPSFPTQAAAAAAQVRAPARRRLDPCSCAPAVVPIQWRPSSRPGSPRSRCRC